MAKAQLPSLAEAAEMPNPHFPAAAQLALAEAIARPTANTLPKLDGILEHNVLGCPN